jgi:hypothetical protein
MFMSEEIEMISHRPVSRQYLCVAKGTSTADDCDSEVLLFMRYSTCN